MAWAAIRWALLMFLIAPAVNAPAVGDAGKPLRLTIEPPSSPPAALATPNPALANLPLQVWECVSGWYGEPFDGQPTASGEPFDMYAATAAHLTLPLGSVVRVVNLRTHRSQVVRINDRGPYVEGRDLDVSYEVARRLGFDQRGLARVRLELLEVPPRPASSNHLND
jgi:rare lipoprotein A